MRYILFQYILVYSGISVLLYELSMLLLSFICTLTISLLIKNYCGSNKKNRKMLLVYLITTIKEELSSEVEIHI